MAVIVVGLVGTVATSMSNPSTSAAAASLGAGRAFGRLLTHFLDGLFAVDAAGPHT